jgi:phage terminase small subunit
MPAAGRLKPRQARFAAEYLIDLNATQAAIRAGYSAKHADVTGPRLLGNVGIAAAIAAGQADRGKRTGITADRVLAEYGKIAFANMGDYMRPGPGGDPVLDFSGLTQDQKAALAEVTVDSYLEGGGEDARTVKRVRFKLGDKLHALDSVAKHLGMFKEQHEVTGKDGAPLVDTSKVALVLLNILSRGRPAPDD